MPRAHDDRVDPRDYCTECGLEHIACRCLVEGQDETSPDDFFGIELDDLDDVTPLPPAPVVGVDFARDGAPVLTITKPRSRAKRRR